MNLAAFLHRAALLHPDSTALGLGNRPLMTYRDFANRVAMVAGHFQNTLGLWPGDRAAIVMSNVPDYMVVKYACWHAGVCAVPINAKLHRKEFSYILEDCGARVCFTNEEKHDAVAALDRQIETLEQIISTDGGAWRAMAEGDPAPMAEVAPDDLAWLFFTSGTTGRPKGAMLSHRNLVSCTMNYFADVDAIEPQDCIVHCAPVSHGAGCYGIPHVARGAAQVFPESGGFDPREMIDLLRHWKGATFFFAPTMVVRLLNHPDLAKADMSNLKLIVYGGGPMYVEDLLRGINVLGQKFVQIFGQGEAPMTITGLTRAMHEDTCHPRYKERLASTGVPRTDIEVRVVNEDDQPLSAGEIGEVVCRGDVVMLGYRNNRDATAEAIKGGWLHTGDIARIDGEGHVYIVDRLKELIKVKGFQVPPAELEALLVEHPEIADAAVVGRPDPESGEVPLAFVVAGPDSSLDAQTVRAYVADHVATYKHLGEVRFIDAIPKSASGKILRRELRKQVAGFRSE